MELVQNKTYTFADYLKLTEDWVELISGKLVKMSPMPSTTHQKISTNIFLDIGNFLKGKNCRVFHPPFDVRLPQKGKLSSDEDIITVVQPDITVICDASKIDERGCLGAPDWIIEILSKGSVRKDTHDKLALYEEAGVREYWIVHPEEQTIIKYLPDDQGRYVGSKPYTKGDKIPVTIFDGFQIDLNEVFE